MKFGSHPPQRRRSLLSLAAATSEQATAKRTIWVLAPRALAPKNPGSKGGDREDELGVLIIESAADGCQLKPRAARETEVAQLQFALGGGARLTTLTGPSGIGKTRLVWSGTPQRTTRRISG